jgi:hypothetical protein
LRQFQAAAKLAVKAKTPRVSGKIFRFLSAMHPALSKAERKRYAGFDPDKWYAWTDEISGEFTELVRRSPRDTSFARGFAYVAQKAVPDGCYIAAPDLVAHLADLPTAFRDAGGSGYSAELAADGRHASVRYKGMPGFENVCIAVQGELGQRLEAAGAQGVVIRHSETCRLSGGDNCDFEVEWSTEAAPKGASLIRAADIVGGDMRNVVQTSTNLAGNGHDGSAATETVVEQSRSDRQPLVEPLAQQPAMALGAAAPAVFSRPDGAVAQAPQVKASEQLLEDDLVTQLKERLAEADRQFRLYSQAQDELERLRLEVAQLKAQSEAAIAQAERDKNEALEALEAVKSRVKAIVSDT